MERIEEFTLKGKNFLFFDMSGFQKLDDYIQFINDAKPVIEKYTELSLYTITNVKQTRFDTDIKNAVAEWMDYNEPYVRYGVVIGTNGIKKLLFDSLMYQTGRDNLVCLNTKEQAISWLQKQD